MEQEKAILPIIQPGIPDIFCNFLNPIFGEFSQPKILEVAAEHGAFIQKLWDEGYAGSTFDLFREIFYFDKIECKKVDSHEH